MVVLFYTMFLQGGFIRCFFCTVFLCGGFCAVFFARSGRRFSRRTRCVCAEVFCFFSRWTRCVCTVFLYDVFCTVFFCTFFCTEGTEVFTEDTVFIEVFTEDTVFLYVFFTEVFCTAFFCAEILYGGFLHGVFLHGGDGGFHGGHGVHRGFQTKVWGVRANEVTKINEATK
jgi:hypothetical protein